MKVPLIVVQHTEVMRGLYVGLRLHGKPSSVEGKGKCYCIIHGI